MSAAKQESARQLRQAGHGYKRIAAALDVSHSTVYRWLNPGYAEEDRLRSAAARRRRTGVCADCGGVTRYHGRGRETSERCAACQRAKQHAERKWTREAVIAALQEWAAEHDGRPPRAQPDWLRASPDGRFPAATTVYSTQRGYRAPFGSWNEAVAAAGLKPRKPGVYGDRMEWTPGAVLDAIRRWHAEHGDTPRQHQWRRADRENRYPAAQTAAYYFGSWNEAIRKAGFTPRPQGYQRAPQAASRNVTGGPPSPRNAVGDGAGRLRKVLDRGESP